VIFLLHTVQNTIRKHALLSRGDGVVAALSGGADSVALLAALRALRAAWSLSLYAVHVNHGLRQQAGRDEKFVRKMCQQWDIPLHVVAVNVFDIAAANKISIEEAGRRVRYEAFHLAAAQFQAQKIATGHNRDDQTETILLHLCRGTGLQGLCGIAPTNTVAGVRRIRPLLETPRADIDAYIMKERLPFIQDETNYSPQFTRNRVRHHIIPVLHAHAGAHTSQVIARSADSLRADAQFLENAAQDAYQQCALQADTLHIPTLLQLPDALKNRVVRIAIASAQNTPQHFTDIHAQHIAAVLDIAVGQSGRRTTLPRLSVSREYDRLLFQKNKPPSPGFSYPLSPGVPLFVPEVNQTFFVQPCTAPPEYVTLSLRTRRAGDKIKLPGGTKKVQDYFTDQKIPKTQRDTIPLIATDATVWWVHGVMATNSPIQVSVTQGGAIHE